MDGRTGVIRNGHECFLSRRIVHRRKEARCKGSIGYTCIYSGHNGVNNHSICNEHNQLPPGRLFQFSLLFVIDVLSVSSQIMPAACVGWVLLVDKSQHSGELQPIVLIHRIKKTNVIGLKV
jgi:hypothetical protein